MNNSKQTNRNKSKKKTSKKPPRITRRARLVARLRQSGAKSVGTLSSFARSLTNPWAGGGCVPDGSRNMGCFTIRGIIQLATGALGSAVGVAIALDPSNLIALDTGNALATYTFPGISVWAQSPNIATIQNTFSRWRPVSGSLKGSFTGNFTACQGTVNAGVIPAQNAVSLLNLGTATTLSTISPISRYGTTSDPIIVKWMPEDSEDFILRGFGAGRTFGQAQVSPYMFFGATGLSVAGAGSFVIEYVLHFEGQYNLGTVIMGETGVVSQRPAEPGWYEKTMNLVRNVAQVVVDTGFAVSTGAARAVAAPYKPLLMLEN